MIQLQKRMELGFWSVLPAVITGGLLIVCFVPKHMAGLNHFMPLLPLIPVFYWGLAQASEMPYWFVFLIGLVTDAVIGLPLGLSSLLYIFFLALLQVQRKRLLKEGFIIKWGCFAALLGATAGLQWVWVSILDGQLRNLLSPFIQWALTVLLYPPLHKIFDVLNQHVHHRRWMILHGR